MGGIVGSAPSAKTTTTPTIDPTQQALISSLASGALGNLGIGGSTQFGQVQPGLTGTYGAPMSPLQTTSISGIQNLVDAFGGGPLSTAPNVAGPLNTAIASQAQRATTPAVSMIDPSVSGAAFQQGVVQPLTQDFTNYTLPGIAGRYGQGAGGAFSSDALQARQQAGTNLDRTLAQTGAQYTLAAEQANQAAQATNAGLMQAAATSLPGLVAAPLGLDTAQAGLLSQGLSAGAVPQATQQTQLSGQYSDYQNQVAQMLQRISDALGLSTAPTQQTQTIVNPGQTGLLPALASAFAGGFGKSYGAGSGGAGLTSLLGGLFGGG